MTSIKEITLSEKTMLQIDEMNKVTGGVLTNSALIGETLGNAEISPFTLTVEFCKPPEQPKDRVCGQKPF